MDVTLEPVTAANWREVEDINAASPHVATVAHYLCLCHYGGVWQPLVIRSGDEVVGFAMWGYDVDDGRHWIGGLCIDVSHQGRGVGRAAMAALIGLLRGLGATGIALSYAPQNLQAERLYASLGFVPVGDLEGELVAVLP
jgi:diamine N-acetyltransferase